MRTNQTKLTQSGRLPAMLAEAMPRAARVLKAWQARRNLAQLRSMDDRMLDDMGLTRADVVRAFETPWYHDPSNDLTIARVRGRGMRFWRR